MKIRTTFALITALAVSGAYAGSITHVIIDGREASLDNKHERLYERYKAR